MTVRFPQSASAVAYRIKPAWASKILVMYWPASADSAHRLRSSDTASTILTRAASGATFNGTTGLIEGNSTTYFTDSISGGYGGLIETSDYTLVTSCFGDMYNGHAGDELIIIGTNTPPDHSDGGGKIYQYGYAFSGGVQNNPGAAFPGQVDDVAAAHVDAMRYVAADATAKLRSWQNGSEVVANRLNPAPSSTSQIGTPARPIYFGGTFTGAGNTKQWFEMALLGTGALTDADLAAITADPSILIETTPVAATVNLTGANSTGGATSGTGAITVTPPVAGTVNLVGANSTGGATSGSGAISVTALTGTITSGEFTAYGNPTPQAGLTVPHVVVIRMTDGVTVLNLANQVTNGAGRLVLVNAAIVAGVWYMLASWNADGLLCGFKAHLAT